MADTPTGPATGDLVRVRGRALRVVVRRPVGPARHHPLLICNGIGATLDLLDPFVAALAPGREVIRFDPPGIGGSPDPALPYHLTTFAPAVGDLVGELGHERVDVLGWSWGGQLAQQLAVGRRAQVRRLVLVATGTGALMVPAAPRVLARFLDPRPPLDPAAARALAAELYGGTVRTHPERAAAALAAIGDALRRYRRGYFAQLWAGAGWTSLPVLNLIRAPTLVLAADDDPIIPRTNAAILRRGIRGAQLHHHPGGHLAIVTEADLLAPIVERFLDAPDQSPGGSES
jgi:poly(3-hydroxyalkanoate) depolymerase